MIYLIKRLTKVFICSIILIMTINNVQAKEILKTSIGEYPLEKYNVAIVGNSHGSYMSNAIKVDNDLNSYTIGNHSIGADNFNSYGCISTYYRYTNNGVEPMALKGDLKGRLQEFPEISGKYNYAILWFGSNCIGWSPSKFRKVYRDYLSRIDRKCKVICMSIPASNDYTKDEVATYSNIIRETALEYSNCYYENIYNIKDVQLNYRDGYHFTNETYKQIWDYLQKKYKIVVKIDKFISHRGFIEGDHTKDNTIESYTLAAQMGYKGIEGDVQYDKNSDNFYMSHDYIDDPDVIAKTCTLDAYLNICKNYSIIPIIDIKFWTIGNVKSLYNKVKKVYNNSINEVRFQSSNKSILMELKKIDPEVKVWYLYTNYNRRNGKTLDIVKNEIFDIKIDGINIEYSEYDYLIDYIKSMPTIETCIHLINKETLKQKYEKDFEYVMTNTLN